MEFLSQNAAVIVTILLVVILAAVVVGVLLNAKLVKNLVSKRFSFHDIKEVDKDSNEQKFSVIVANRSLNDITASAIGVVSGLKFFDFQSNYTDSSRRAESKPVIPQRASIKLSIGIEELEALIFSNAQGDKIPRTFVYVIDSSGNLSKCRARNFHKILRADFQALLKKRRAEKKRGEFEELKEEIARREAAGNPVKFGERIRLVFARFPKGSVPEPGEGEGKKDRGEADQGTGRPDPEEVPDEILPPDDLKSEAAQGEPDDGEK